MLEFQYEGLASAVEVSAVAGLAAGVDLEALIMSLYLLFFGGSLSSGIEASSVPWRAPGDLAFAAAFGC